MWRRHRGADRRPSRFQEHDRTRPSRGRRPRRCQASPEANHVTSRHATLSSGLDLTVTGLGGTGLENLYTAVETEAAVAAVHAAVTGGIRYFDTAPVYGLGLAEPRLGEALRTLPATRW